MQLQSSEGQVQVSEEVFDIPLNEALVHQVVVSYMAGGRQGSKAQKSRSDVRGGGKKPWRQKGTGRARAGTSRSPIWRSGGVTFAATPRDFSQKVNRKMYQGAMRCILSQLIRDERLVVVESVTVDKPKTALLRTWLSSKNINSALILVDEVERNLTLSARNIPNVRVCEVSKIDPASLISYDNVVVTEKALKLVESKLLKVAA